MGESERLRAVEGASPSVPDKVYIVVNGRNYKTEREALSTVTRSLLPLPFPTRKNSLTGLEVTVVRVPLEPQVDTRVGDLAA